jgi:bacteriorhodopsin
VRYNLLYNKTKTNIMKTKKKEQVSGTQSKGGFSVNIELLKTSLYWFTFALMLLILAVIFVYFLRNSKQI